MGSLEERSSRLKMKLCWDNIWWGDPWDPPFLRSTGTSNKSLPNNLLDLSALVGAALDEVCTFKNWISCEKLHQWWVLDPPKLDCSCWSTHPTFWILQSDGHNIWWSVLALMIVVSRFRICDIDLLTNTIPYVIWVQVLKVSLSSRVHPLFLRLTAFFPSSLSSEVWIL